MTSVLEMEYIEPTRPYSLNELAFLRNKSRNALRIGQNKAHHKKCDHFYLVKENGRKEKEMKEQKSCDTGNCSVCWKVTKTPRHLKTCARNLIDAYSNTFYNEPQFLTYNILEIETSFYKWLYTDY